MMTCIFPLVVLFCLQSAWFTTSLAQNEPLEIVSLHYNIAVKSRYSIVNMKQQMRNPQATAHKAVLSILLPEDAFVSNFSMIINDKEYVGAVKDSKEAAKIAEEAGLDKQAIGQPASKDMKVRFSNKFDVTIDIGPNENITVLLTYEQLMKRKRGMYEHITNINPNSIVEDFRLEMVMIEDPAFKFVRVLKIRKPGTNQYIDEGNKHAVVEKHHHRVYIEYFPTTKQQEQVSIHGVNGQFVVQYDLDREKEQGILQVDGEYFAFFFAPETEVEMNKHTILVIDTSGSMSGNKMVQTKEALKFIFDSLEENDFFTMIEFDSDFKVWNGQQASAYDLASDVDEFPIIQATKQNLEDVKTYANSLLASGGTNINDALLIALKCSEKTADSPTTVAQIVLLTDGSPSVGVSDTQKIEENIRTENLKLQTPIYCLAFGTGADFAFLERLASQNYGPARKIYEGTDASSQLESFFQEISTALLLDITVNVPPESFVRGSIPKSRFKDIFGGSELVVPGKLKSSDLQDFQVVTSARSSEGLYSKTFEPKKTGGMFFLGKEINFIEKLWAFMNIQERFAVALKTYNGNEEVALRKDALKLSLKYNFVNEITSVVVQRPQAVAVSKLVSTDNFKKNVNDKNKDEESLKKTGLCQAWGDPHYITYDAFKYDFQGCGWYVFSKDCNDTWEVLTENEYPIQLAAVTSVRAVKINIKGISILLQHANDTALVNGAAVAIPHNPASYSLTRNSRVWTFDMVDSEGVKVVYHGRTVNVILEKRWQGKTCGLCGNWDSNQEDEKLLEKSSENWFVGDQVCEKPENIKEVTEEDIEMAEEKCRLLTRYSGVCSEFMVDRFYEDCVFDVSHCGEACLCDILEDAALQCSISYTQNFDMMDSWVDLVQACLGQDQKEVADSTVQGNLHYTTFDGVTHNFQGQYEYIFAADKNKAWEVITTSEPLSSQPNMNRISKVKVKFGETEISMENKNITVDGDPVRIPFIGFGFTILSHGNTTQVTTKHGLKVLYNSWDFVKVDVDERWLGKTQGLAGVWNRDKSDEENMAADYKRMQRENIYNQTQFNDPPEPPKCESQQRAYNVCLEHLLVIQCEEVEFEPSLSFCAADVCVCGEDCMTPHLRAYYEQCYDTHKDPLYLRDARQVARGEPELPDIESSSFHGQPSHLVLFLPLLLLVPLLDGLF